MNDTNFRWAIEKKIALSEIGNRTIQKQFITNYHGKNHFAIAKEVIKAYREFCADINKTYSTYGSVKLSRYLREAHNIVVSEKTLISWLRSMGVEIQKPTRERKRVVRTKWEFDVVRKIEDLSQNLEFAERQYKSVVDELMVCKSDLRICEREKESFMRKLAGCREELKEIIITG